MGADHKILRIKQIVEITGLGRSTIYEHMAIGLFPSPIKIGKRAVGWLDSDISAWIAACVSQSRNTSPTSSNRSAKS